MSDNYNMSHPDPYNMSHLKRGKAVIFCHDEFKEQDGVTPIPQASLPGHKVDKTQLEGTLKKMGWDKDDISLMNNQPLEEIKKKMKELKDADHTSFDCVLVVVLTHGDEEGLYDSESNRYDESELWEPFVGVQSLVGKPKILIRQACRGDKVRYLLLFFSHFYSLHHLLSA